MMGGNNFAARLADDLKRRGYSVYFNPNEQYAGEFPDRLRNAVKNCKDFILNPDAITRSIFFAMF